MNKKLIGIGLIGLSAFLLFMPKTQKVTVGSGGGGVGTNWGFTETAPAVGESSGSPSPQFMSLPDVNIYESSTLSDPTSKKLSHAEGTIVTTKPNKVLEIVGYQGQSNIDGTFSYIKTPITARTLLSSSNARQNQSPAKFILGGR